MILNLCLLYTVGTCELFSCTCVRIFFEKLGVRLDGVDRNARFDAFS
jgi:hypothetical protein